MGVVVDIIIIALIALSTFLAYRKGLVALAIKLCAVIIAVVATLLLYKPISNLIINTTNIDETVQNALFDKASESISEGNNDNDVLGSVLVQAKNGALAETTRDLSIKIVNICVIIILFFGIKFALKFVTAIANKVAKLPIINKFNKIGGILYGLIRGFVIVYACLLLIGFIGKVNPKHFLHQNVEQSNIGRAMYENNIFNALL